MIKKVFLSISGLFLMSTAVLAMNGAIVFNTNEDLDNKEKACTEKLGANASEFAIRNCMGTTLRKEVREIKKETTETRDQILGVAKSVKTQFKKDRMKEIETMKNKLKEASSMEERKAIMDEVKQKTKEQLKDKKEKMVKDNILKRVESLKIRLGLINRRFNAYNLKVNNINNRIEERLKILENKGYDFSSLEEIRVKTKEYPKNIKNKIEAVELKIMNLDSSSLENINEIRKLISEIREDFKGIKLEIKSYFSEMRGLVKEIKNVVRKQQIEIDNSQSSDVSNPNSLNLDKEKK